jgi:hypothetical protein
MTAPLLSRREALRQTIFFSAALALGARANFVRAEDIAADGGHQFLMIGDYGVGTKDQIAVAKAMQDYAADLKFTPDGLFLVGDNFYGAFPEGLDSPRWKTEFEDMYPAKAFPGPCWAILGNHDYDNEPVTKVKAELAYHDARPGTRWTMPAKWYRFEWPAKDPVMTCLMLDSNYKNSVDQLKPEERAAQLQWLKAELAKPRTTPWLVAMGHHPLYNNGHHGDRKDLIAEWGPLFQDHGVDFYFCGHDHDLQHIEFEGKRTSFVLSGAGGQSLHDVNVNGRGPFGLKVHGFSHLQVSKDKFTVRHLDVSRKQVHAFSKTPAGKIQILG